MERRFAGKVALVTGATTGIGQATAVRLAAEGAIVGVNQKPGLDATETLRLVEKVGGKAFPVIADMRDPDAVKAMVLEVAKQGGRLDYVVSNAAINPFMPWDETSIEDFDNLFETNVRGSWVVCTEAARQMIAENHGGAIVMISSISAHVGSPTQVAYCGTKGAISMLGKAERGWLPSRAPVGYQNELLKNIIIKDEERFHLVRKMWDMMLTGNFTPSQIRNIASNEWGFRTAKHKRDGGKEMTDSMIYKMFNNIFYTGMFEWSRQRYQGKHAPMISMEEYTRVQTLLGRDGNPRAQTKHYFAYTGVFRCGECGSMHTALEKIKKIKKTDKLRTYVYYYCTRKKKKVTICTQRKTLEVADLEIQIIKDIVKSNILPEFRQWAVDIINKSNDSEIEERTRVYEMLHKSLTATQRELDTLTQMRYRELIDDETYLKEKVLLTTKRDQLEEKLHGTEDRAKKWLELTEKTFDFVTYSLKAFDKGDYRQRREILGALGKNFFITNQKMSIEANDWLVPIIEKYPPLEAEYKRLELVKYGSPEARKDAFASLRVSWGAYRDSNPD